MIHIVDHSSPDFDSILLCQADNGQIRLDVQLRDETVWLTQAQMAFLFQTERSIVTKHINNIFKSGELTREAVCANFAQTASDGKTYQTNFYNLDVIIAVGYRVNSKRGTQFRIWVSSVLKEYLVKGYALNQRRLAEQGVAELRGVLNLLAATLEHNQLTDATSLAVVELVRRYGVSWQLLLQYDEDRLAIHQTFGGEDLYPSIEEKAAHLLYFVIKDHPFSDGNKRIGSFLFLLYLQESSLVDAVRFDNKALVVLALLVAASDPIQKDVLIRLIVNLLGESTQPDGGRQHG